jgi:hypothetical protein
MVRGFQGIFIRPIAVAPGLPQPHLRRHPADLIVNEDHQQRRHSPWPAGIQDERCIGQLPQNAKAFVVKNKEKRHISDDETAITTSPMSEDPAMCERADWRYNAYSSNEDLAFSRANIYALLANAADPHDYADLVGKRNDSPNFMHISLARPVSDDQLAFPYNKGR